MLEMEEIIKSINDAKFHFKIKVIVGGSPVSECYPSSIGADAYSKNASEAVEKAINLLK